MRAGLPAFRISKAIPADAAAKALTEPQAEEQRQMANESRTPGKHGWKPRDPDRWVPTLEHYLRPWEGEIAPSQHFQDNRRLLATGLPPAMGNIDRETRVPDWPMYLNDQEGDCTIAGKAHSFSAMCVYAGQPFPTFSSTAINTAYSAVSGYDPATGANDNGADLVTVLEYMRSTGLTDETGKVHKVAGYALVGHPTNTGLLAQVLSTFGTVYSGSLIQQAQEDQFSMGQPWQYDPSSSIAGGHCYVLQRRRVGGIGVMEYITWGAVTRATMAFVGAFYSANTASPGQGQGEAYAVVSHDFIQANGTTVQGLDLEQLLADMDEVQ